MYATIMKEQVCERIGLPGLRDPVGKGVQECHHPTEVDMPTTQDLRIITISLHI